MSKLEISKDLYDHFYAREWKWRLKGRGTTQTEVEDLQAALAAA